uniref:Uncharacterized protein n=1 Tax=Cacopsylla melanoneura TaxID=428564 RepID=A0A8D9BFA0_9HEMI
MPFLNPRTVEFLNSGKFRTLGLVGYPLKEYNRTKIWGKVLRKVSLNQHATSSVESRFESRKRSSIAIVVSFLGVLQLHGARRLGPGVHVAREGDRRSELAVY